MQVKTSIDAWSERLMRESKLARVAGEGALGPRALALYLESLRYVFLNSQQNLATAAARSRALQFEDLAAHFDEKVVEERGHEAWAQRDLTRLPKQATERLQPAQGSRRLVALQQELIAEHPICFLAYAVWAEYFTAMLGPAWLSMLAQSGYEREDVTAVANHVEADSEHAELGLAALDRLWRGEPDAAIVIAAITRAQRAFETFCDEIGDVALSERAEQAERG